MQLRFARDWLKSQFVWLFYRFTTLIIDFQLFSKQMFLLLIWRNNFSKYFCLSFYWKKKNFEYVRVCSNYEIIQDFILIISLSGKALYYLYEIIIDWNLYKKKTCHEFTCPSNALPSRQNWYFLYVRWYLLRPFVNSGNCFFVCVCVWKRFLLSILEFNPKKLKPEAKIHLKYQQ